MEDTIIKEIKRVEHFDRRRYKFTFVNNQVKWITSVTEKLSEYREQGIERFRENVGSEEANQILEEAGEWGGIVHHGCFLLATGGAVLFEPPAYQTIGIENEEVAELVKQNKLIRQQLDVKRIPYLTINDERRFLQCAKFKFWLGEVKPEILFAETVVYSLEKDIAGRIDFLMKVKEGDYMIAGAKEVHLPEGVILPDVKSGSWSDKHWLQMAAYREAVKESLGLDVVATVGIHLKAQTKTGLNTLVHAGAELDRDFTDYQHVAAIYDRKHPDDTPEDFKFESVLLSENAAKAIPLGATMPNPVAEKAVEAGIPQETDVASPRKSVYAKDRIRNGHQNP